jgi:hypothetical protein
MASHLDVAYNALKANGSGPVTSTARECTEEAADALSRMLLARCLEVANGDVHQFKKLYEEHSPKALVLITMVLDSLTELPTENSATNDLMDVVLAEAAAETSGDEEAN